jgi:hypothetical protein
MLIEQNNTKAVFQPTYTIIRKKFSKGEVMLRPKGFGKCYFSLRAILAYATAPVLHAASSSYTHRDRERLHLVSVDEEEEDPPDILLNTASTLNKKPCHCNCYFRARTKLLLKLFKRIPKCNCKCRFFSFRRTGTHPPYVLSLPHTF